MNKIEKNNLKINTALFNFINKEVLPGTNITEENFWSNFSSSIYELAPLNKKLLERREEIQKKN